MIRTISYKVKNTILITFLFITMIYGYTSFVHPVFEYSGFKYTENTYKIIESSILFVITLGLINYRKISKFIYAVNMIIFLFMTIPNYILYMFMDTPKVIIYSYFLLHFLIIMISMLKLNFKSYSIKSTQENKILLILSFLLLLPFFIKYGFNLNFNVLLLQDIYEVRATSIEGNNIFTNYFYSWLSRVVLPFLIVYGVIKKKKTFLIIGSFATLYLFLIAAHKSVFFGLLMLLYLNLFQGYYKKIFALFITVMIAFIVGMLVYVLNDNVVVSSMFLRRVFFLPTLLNHYYFDFFADNYLYLSHSIFKSIVHYPYNDVPSHVIGLEYFHTAKMGANNGIISDGFMNFGYIGIVINILIVSLIIKFFQAIKLNEFLFPIVFLFIFSLNSSALLTVLLTHGLFLFLLMSLFFNKKLNLIQKVKK